MRVSGCNGYYEFVLSAGAKAKSVTNNLPILSVLAVEMSHVAVKSLDNKVKFYQSQVSQNSEINLLSCRIKSGYYEDMRFKIMMLLFHVVIGRC